MLRKKKVNIDADCGQENGYTRNLVCSSKVILITVTWALPPLVLTYSTAHLRIIVKHGTVTYFIMVSFIKSYFITVLNFIPAYYFLVVGCS